jgi:hypothetical protein
LAETLKKHLQTDNRVKLFSFLNKKTNKTSYKCSCCGQIYDEVPLCFGSDCPSYYYSIPSNELDVRVELKESLCVIDKEHFFHRGRLTIPIIDHSDNLVFNVWTSISADNFAIRMDLWNDTNRINQEPYFGWLQTIVPTYGDTLNLKAIAIEQEAGKIPEIKMIEENHPLTLDQENGISYKKTLEIVDKILRQQHQNG